MNTAPQELLKEYVQSQHFTNTAEIMVAMKEMFRDVVQTVMEVEMDEELGAGTQPAGDHVLRPRCRLIPGCRRSRQAGQHSHLRCVYRPACRDLRWPRTSARRLRPFHRATP